MARVHVPGTPAGPDDPSVPRVYEYLTGGTDYFAADKELAELLMDPALGGHPGLRQLAEENRGFVLEAARWSAAMLGISQFIDVGCGLPAVPMVHDSARSAIPSARVAYVDRDPMVVRHVGCVQAEEGWEGAAVIEGDARDPAAVLRDKRLLEVIDLSQPACVIFGGTLSSMATDEARGAVTGYADAMAPGSAVVISAPPTPARRSGSGWPGRSGRPARGGTTAPGTWPRSSAGCGWCTGG